MMVSKMTLIPDQYGNVPDESVLTGVKEFPKRVRGYFVAIISLEGSRE